MSGYTPILDSLAADEQRLVHAMADAAEEAMRRRGITPVLQGRCALIVEACAALFIESGGQQTAAAGMKGCESLPGVKDECQHSPAARPQA